MAEAGHTFLARLGKRRLRPGGKKATEWLLHKGGITPETRLLEVACNMGTTAIELVSRYRCMVTACDLDKEALARARENVEKAGLSNRICLHHADATALPFADASFDVVLNEAMLTMLSMADKAKALGEYYRALKPGGILLTHDVVLFEESEREQSKIRQEISRAINVPVMPLTRRGWHEELRTAGFTDPEELTGPMTLMSISGMLHDEGIINTLRLAVNGIRGPNQAMFSGMRKVFADRKDQVGFIALAARKKTAASKKTADRPEGEI